MAGLKFYKVSSLPASCTLGDVYYVTGKGIYVCTTAASSGAAEGTNYTKFATMEAATDSVAGLITTATVKGTKVDSATAADSATKDGSGNVITSTYATATNLKAVTDAYIKSASNTADTSVTAGKTLKVTDQSGNVYSIRDTDTHNSHKVTVTNGTATSSASTATSIDVVTSVNSSTAASDSDIAVTTTRYSVPTLKVTNDLASRISTVEGLTATGMQYGGTIASIGSSTAYTKGYVYRVTTKISLPAAQSATGSAVSAEVGDFIVCSTGGTGTAAIWDVWQANVDGDAYWASNSITDGRIVAADGTAGKLKNIDNSTSLTGSTSKTVTALAQDANGKITTFTTADIAIAESQVTNLSTDLAAKEPTSTAVRHTASTAVGSATRPVYVASNGTATACTYSLNATVPSNAVFTDTHYTNSFTINDGQSTAVAAQTFSQDADKTLQIKASASGNLTASSVSASANSGVLTISVGVASGYAIPTSTQITDWNAKYDASYATTSSAGIASFNSSNFSVSSGAVSLAWAAFS